MKSDQQSNNAMKNNQEGRIAKAKANLLSKHFWVRIRIENTKTFFVG